MERQLSRVRREDSGESFYAEIGSSPLKVGFPSFQIAVVADVVTPGAFDEAVKGIDIFVHTASPLFGSDTSVRSYPLPLFKDHSLP